MLPSAARSVQRRCLAPGVGTRSAIARAENCVARSRARHTRVDRRADAARAPRASARARTARTACPRRRERLRVDAHGRGEHGHVAGERLEHRQAEALALGGDEHGVGRVDPQRHACGSTPPSAQQLARRRARRARARDRSACSGARGRPGTAGSGGPGRGRARRAPDSRGERPEALDVHAAGQHERPLSRGCGRAARQRAPPRRPRAGRCSGSAAAVARRVRGWRRSVPCTVSARTRAGTASAGQAVRPKCACTTSKRRAGAGDDARGADRPRRAASARGPGGNSYSCTSIPSMLLAARRPGRGRSCRARGARRRAACWRPRARARSPDRSALE